MSSPSSKPQAKTGSRKRGVTREEHQAILAREKNPEWKAFLELVWHVGAALGDLAALRAAEPHPGNVLLVDDASTDGAVRTIAQWRGLLRGPHLNSVCFPSVFRESDAARAACAIASSTARAAAKEPRRGDRLARRSAARGVKHHAQGEPASCNTSWGWSAGWTFRNFPSER
jgi:hypothetical protein